MVKDNTGNSPDFRSKRFSIHTEKEMLRSELANYVTYKKREMQVRGESSVQKCPYNRTSVERIVDNS